MKKNRYSPAEKKLFEELLQKKFSAQKPDPVFKNLIFAKLVQENFSPTTKNKFSLEQFINSLLKLYTIFKRASKLAFLSILLTLTATATTFAYLSPTVTRQSNLYFLKQAVEKIELATTLSEEKKVEKFIKFSGKRIDEAKYLSEKGVIDQKTIQEIVENTNKAIENLQKIEDDQKRIAVQEELKNVSKKQKIQLQEIIINFEEKNTVSNSNSQNQQNIPTSEEEEEIISENQEVIPQKIPAVEIIEEQIETLEQIENNINLDEVNLDNEEDFSIEEDDVLIDPSQEEEENKTVVSDNNQAEVNIISFNKDTFALNQIENFSLKLRNNSSFKSSNFYVQITWPNGQKERKIVNNINPSTLQEIHFNPLFTFKGNFTLKINLLEGNIKEKEFSHNISVKEICNNIGTSICQGKEIFKCNTWDGEKIATFKKISTCSSNQDCQNGKCINKNTCQNKCSQLGNKKCSGNKILLCQKQSSGCLDWSFSSNCSTNQNCSNGKCINISSCQNECSNGQKICSNGKLKTCGNFDSDSCTEWKISTCSDGTYCKNGACTSLCSNKCEKSGEKKCLTSNKVFQCGFWDNSTCLSWKLIETCSNEKVCENGECLYDFPEGYSPDDFEWEM